MKSLLIVLLCVFLFQFSEQANVTMSVTTSSGAYVWTQPTIDINAGDFVTWNGIGAIHNVAQVNSLSQQTLVTGGFQSGGIGAVSTFTFQFLTNGTFYYICQAHSATQQGTVTVGNGINPTTSTGVTSTTATTGKSTGPTVQVTSVFLLVAILIALLF